MENVGELALLGMQLVIGLTLLFPLTLPHHVGLFSLCLNIVVFNY